MIFTKRDENSLAEYYTTTYNEKLLTIRLNKASGAICLTCVTKYCKHVVEFDRWRNKTPDPWDTPEGLTVEGAK